MIYLILSALGSSVLSVIEMFGYVGIFILMAAESCGIPIPSELIMPFAGFLVSRGSFSLGGIVAAGTLGNLSGSFLFYEIGRRWGRPFIDRYGRYLLIHVRDMEWADRWFARWGAWAALTGRLLPGIRTYISFPAGAYAMNRKTFFIFSSIGILPWVAALGWFGMKLGSRWEELRRFFHAFDLAIAVGIIFLVVWWVTRHIRHRAEDRGRMEKS